MELQEPGIRFAPVRTIGGPLGNHRGGFLIAGRTRLLNVNTDLDSLRVNLVNTCATRVDDASRNFTQAAFKITEPKPNQESNGQGNPGHARHQAELLAAFAAAVVTIRAAANAAMVSGRMSDQDSLIVAKVISSMKDSVTQAITSMKSGIDLTEKSAPSIAPSIVAEMRQKMERMVEFWKEVLETDKQKDVDMPVERPSMH